MLVSLIQVKHEGRERAWVKETEGLTASLTPSPRSASFCVSPVFSLNFGKKVW